MDCIVAYTQRDDRKETEVSTVGHVGTITSVPHGNITQRASRTKRKVIYHAVADIMQIIDFVCGKGQCRNVGKLCLIWVSALCKYQSKSLIYLR